VRRVLRSFGYALEGLSTMLRTQPNFVVHLIAAALALALGAVLRLSPPEFAVIVLAIALVLAVECVNTTLETLCDLVQPGFHPLIKRAKDVSAGAVLIAAIGSVVIALVVFGPHVAGMVK
jgi:diacylglycerol kinase (ATP)